MRLSIKITGLLLTFVLLTSCEAATENKDLPTKEEITDFIAGIPVTDNYINTVYDAVIDKHPTWNCVNIVISYWYTSNKISYLFFRWEIFIFSCCFT